MSEKHNYIEKDELIIKKLAGEANKQELADIDAWIAQDTQHQKYFEEFERVWTGTLRVKGVTSDDTENEWKRLEKVIDASEQKPRSSFSWFRLAAAVALLAVASSAIYFVQRQLSTVKVTSAMQSISEANLTDGTSIALNANSTLQYNREFNNVRRLVTLSGEAFFDVAKDTAKPFVVMAQEIEIEVVGTSFNVRAYPNSDKTEITVASGVVKVRRQGTTESGITLRPGNVGVYDHQSDTLYMLQNAPVNYLSWKTKAFMFEDTPLSEVVSLLNNTYHQNISIKNKELIHCPITVSFDKQPLESILKVLESTLDLQVVSQKDGIVLDGTGCY